MSGTPENSNESFVNDMVKKQAERTRWNVVISINFDNMQDYLDCIKRFRDGGSTVLYHGSHSLPIMQKVITQEVLS